MQDLSLFKEVPGYRPILRAVLKHQIQTLINQLACHTGEESVLISASVEEGTLTHIGSDFGKNFVDGHEEIKAQFLGFCLKRNQISKAVKQEPEQFTRKKGPFPARGRGAVNKAFTGNQRHRPYPVTLTKVEPVYQEDRASYQTANQSTVQTTQSAAYFNQSVFPTNEKLQQNQSATGIQDQKHNANQSTTSECTEIIAESQISATSSETQGEASVISTTAALTQPSCTASEVGPTKLKIIFSKSHTDANIQDTASHRRSGNERGIEMNTGSEMVVPTVIDAVNQVECDNSNISNDTERSNSSEQFENADSLSYNSDILKEETATESDNSLTTSSMGKFHYTLGLGLSERKSQRKAQEPRKNIPILPKTNRDSSIKSEPFSDSVVKSETSISRKNNNKITEVSVNGKPKSAFGIISNKKCVIGKEKSAQERKLELENYLYQDHTARPYPCALCPKRFKERHHLIYHMRTHSGQRPYACNICGKCFTQSSSLNTHKKTHFKDLHCGKCSQVFRRQAEYLNHACVWK
ncbi:gastrula zinc finger protein xFG20-1-like [Mya arenaria]|uniref:gastrula zinc finger protein xFG20-1-like n=1 Tax=Mya arenaria TaxID=6604 RepID=UPI0022E4129D|nr:gastrula zinc finger protein xFG20-1-like [Mya arenaria]XP_052786958.1 gastrula zinc finger protein xFG20-1-like [Mya arenaria]